jgi:hypothetical protein
LVWRRDDPRQLRRSSLDPQVMITVFLCDDVMIGR